MSIVNQYSDSSDDDVCFGPYTLKEAKKDLRKYLGKKVNRRHSTICKLRENSVNTPEEKYLMANESLSLERSRENSEFVEKHSKVMNESPSEASSYITAPNQTNTFENTRNEIEDTFLERFKNHTKLALDIDHPTLVENTHISHDIHNHDVFKDDSIITISDDSFSQSAYEIITDKDLNNFKSSIMSTEPIKCENLLSDTINDEYFTTSSNVSNGSEDRDHTNSLYEDNTSDLMSENQDYDFLHDGSKDISKPSKSYLNLKTLDASDPDMEQKEYSCNIDLQDSSYDLLNRQDFSGNTSPDINEFQVPSEEKCERVIVGHNQLSKISEKTESETSKNSQSTDMSPVQVPEIKLELFDDSSQFDDTLEDMNRFLAQEMHNIEPKTTPSKINLLPFDTCSSNNSSNGSGKDKWTPVMKISTSTLSTNSIEKCKKFLSAEKIRKPSAEIKGSTTTVKPRYQESRIKPPSVSAKNLFSKHTDRLGDNAFKVPANPAKKLPTPTKLQNPYLKNVVSPVGIYIRYSPKYCPMIKVTPNTKTSNKLIREVDQIAVKENLPCTSNTTEFPQIIYKPAKTKIVKEEKNIVLPRNIQKLIRNEVVTKHEMRFQDDKANQSIERKLMESDLTVNFNDSSISNQDISILTHKQAFNVKKF